MTQKPGGWAGRQPSADLVSGASWGESAGEGADRPPSGTRYISNGGLLVAVVQGTRGAPGGGDVRVEGEPRRESGSQPDPWGEGGQTRRGPGSALPWA